MDGLLNKSTHESRITFPSAASILAEHPAEPNIGPFREINQSVIGNFWLILNIREELKGAMNISINHRHQGDNVEQFLSMSHTHRHRQQ